MVINYFEDCNKSHFIVHSWNHLVHLLFLEHYNWICFEVGDVNSLSFRNDLWMFSHHEPAAMREEEPSGGVVGICIGVGVFVVLTVITHPSIQSVLGR